MAKWWETIEPIPPSSAPRRRTTGLARTLETEQPGFLDEQAALDEADFVARREAQGETARALNQSDAQMRAALPAASGLARTIIGDEEQGTADLQEARVILDREARFAPKIQRLEDIEDGGDALAYGRNAVLSNLPTMVPTIAGAAATGGASALIGAGLRGAAKKGLTRAVGNALTARTGTAAGAVAGSSVMQTPQVLDAALDTDSPDDAQTRAGKAALGAITTGALDALPQISLLSRLGLGGAAKRVIAPQMRERVLKEAGKQALQEGTTESIQTLGENLTHKWVNDNVDAIGPQAFSDYLNAFVAGGLVGGTIGGVAGIRPNQGEKAAAPDADARSWVKETFSKLRTTQVPGPRPAAEFDQPADPVKATIDSAKASLEQMAATTLSAVKFGATKADGAVNSIFGRHMGIIAEEDFDQRFDDLINRFNTLDRDGLATSDENGIIGRTQNDGFVRGGVPFNGFSLFKPELADSIWRTARESGKPVSTFQAYAMSALPREAFDVLDKEPIKAAALFLSTGDRSAVNEKALADYLGALDPDGQIQFLFAANRISEMVKKGREAEGVQEITPRDVRKMVDAPTEPLRSAVDVDDKTNFDLRTELSDDPEGESFADFQQQQAMDVERPAPVSLNEVVRALPFVDTRSGPREGAIRVTNTKGNPRDVSLASLVAQGWKAAGEGVFEVGKNGVVDVVAQAIDVLQQRGMVVDPEQIKAGLWLGGKTRLSPRQARMIRNGMKPAQARPVQETPGLPNVPAGERPLQLDTDTSDQIQGEDGVENMTGDEDAILRPRTRSPLGMRVSPEGRLQEAETIDTTAADDVSKDQRDAETDAIDAMNRASKVLGFVGPIKGKNLDEKIRDFAARANHLKVRTPKMQAAIDGARSAIQRIERKKPKETEQRYSYTKRDGTKVTGREHPDTGAREPTDYQQRRIDDSAARLKLQRDVGIITERTEAEDKAFLAGMLAEINRDAESYANMYLNSSRELAADPETAFAESLDTEVAELLTTEEGRAQLLEQAERSFSMPAVEQLMRAAVKADPTQAQFLNELVARLRLVQSRAQRRIAYAPGRARITPGKNTQKWTDAAKILTLADRSTSDTAAMFLETFGSSLSSRQRAMLKLMAKSAVLKQVRFTSSDPTNGGPRYNPAENTIYMTKLDRMGSASAQQFVSGMHPADVFIHEATHALTYRGEQVNRAVAKDLDALLAHVRKHASEAGYPIDVMYGLLNTQEFLAEAFSNPEMQEILRRIPPLNTDTFKNSWEQFKSIIAKLFGLFERLTHPTNTALEEALTLGMTASTWTKSVNDFAKFFNRVTAEQEEAQMEAELELVMDSFVLPPSAPTSAPSNLFNALKLQDRVRLEKTLRDPKVFEQIYNAADPDTRAALEKYGQDLPALVNLGAALHADGRLDLEQGTGLNKLTRMVRRVLGLPSNADVSQQIFADHAAGQVLRGKYDGEARAFDRNEYTKNMLAVRRAVRRTVEPIYDKFTMDVGRRMRESMVPALRQAASLFETRAGENAGEPSYVQEHQRFFSQHATAYMEAVQGLKDDQKRAVVRALQANQRPEDPVLGAAFDRTRALYNQLFTWANKNGVKLKFRRDYMPIVMDRKLVEENWDEFKALLAKPEYEDEIRAFFKDSTTDLDVLADRMVQIAQTADSSHVGEVEFGLGIYTPSMAAQRAQIMGFLDRADRAKLAEFQVDSLDAVTLGYISQLAKKAAFVKVFGQVTYDSKGEQHPNRLGRLRDAAKRQGASKEDIALFDDFAKMMLGSYKAELNPAIRWVFSKVDAVFDKNLEDMTIEEWAHYQQALMTYQNLRLLALAPLSSLIDSLGTLARGGSLVDAGRSIWDGIRALRGDDQLRSMAEQLGVIEKYALSDALAATYGGQFDPQGKLGKINNALFKYNGLEAITRHSRLAALAMGHRFLLRHALNPSQHSERLLKELQLTAEDVQVDLDNPKFVKMTPKVENALRRFVFEAVVRPQPSQRPAWHNDPNFMFAAQYKGYLYAFYTTIVGRMVHEAEQGNYSQALIPLVPYLAVTVSAEMLRYAIQHPDEEDPRDAAEYMTLAMVRSGLVGPRFGVFNDARTDAQYGSWVTNSWIGPTGQQATDLVDVATGDRSFGKTAIEALPGSAIFEDWTWGPENNGS